jgi:hypothetical protein
MPQYEFKHKETGETKTIFLGLSEYDSWKKDNEEWERYFGTAPTLVSGTKSNLSMAGKDWQEHLGNIKKGAGQSNTIKT